MSDALVPRGDEEPSDVGACDDGSAPREPLTPAPNTTDAVPSSAAASTQDEDELPQINLRLLDQRPMHFANPWPEHVRKQQARRQAEKQIKEQLKKEFRQLYNTERSRAKIESRIIMTQQEIFSRELRRRTDAQIEKLSHLIELQYATMQSREADFGVRVAPRSLIPRATSSEYLVDPGTPGRRGSLVGYAMLPSPSPMSQRRGPMPPALPSDENSAKEAVAAAAPYPHSYKSNSLGPGGDRRPTDVKGVLKAMERAKQRVRERHQHHGRRASLELDCRVDILDKNKRVRWVNCGFLRYVGTLHFTSGRWVGIELDRKYQGKNDGSVEGRRYFQTKVPDRGIFVRVECCQRATGERGATGSGRRRSHGSPRGRSHSPGDMGQGGEGKGSGMSQGGDAERGGAGGDGGGGAGGNPSAQAEFAKMRADESYAKYFNMLRVGVPKSGVAQKMMADGITADLIRVFLTEGEADPDAVKEFEVLFVRKAAPEDHGDEPARKERERKARARAALGLRKVHWESLDPDKAARSIFGIATKASTGAPRKAKAQLAPKDLFLLKHYFAQVKPAKGVRAKGIKKKAVQQATLISNQRATNIGIMLSKFKMFDSYADILKALLTQDKRLSEERLESLFNMVPSPAETPKLLAYHGKKDAEDLTAGEKFCLEMVAVSRIQLKVEASLFCNRAGAVLHRCEETAGHISSACREIIASRRLARIFQLFLTIGNTMNQQETQGFTLDSFLRLVTTKATSSAARNKITLLDFFVQLVAENGEGYLLSVSQDLPSLSHVVQLADISFLQSERAEIHKNLVKTCSEVNTERTRRQEIKEEEAKKRREEEEEEERKLQEEAEAERRRKEAAAAAAAAVASSTAPDCEEGAVGTTGSDPIAKYRKMLKMGLPRGAVEQKMAADGVDAALLDTSEPPQVLTVAPEPDLEKYRKMLRMGLPRGAVEQKMAADGVPPGRLDSPTGPQQNQGGGASRREDGPAAAAAGDGAAATAADGVSPGTGKPLRKQPKTQAPLSDMARYRKMLKMGLPRGAVEQKMAAEGVDPAELDRPETSCSPVADVVSAPNPPTSSDALGKYRKMLKMGLPRGAVEQKMSAEGIDPGLLDHTESALPPASVGTPTEDPSTATDSEEEGDAEKKPPTALAAKAKIMPLGAAAGNPKAALLAAIAGGVGKLRRRRSAISAGKNSNQNELGPEVDEYVRKMTQSIEGIQHSMRRMEAHVGTAVSEVRSLRRHFGEQEDILESCSLFKELKTFTDLLAQATRTYERAQGRIVTVTAPRRGVAKVLPRRRRDLSRSIDEGDLVGVDGEDVAGYEGVAAVGQRVATSFGTGVVEAIRVHEEIYMVRLAWGAVAFLQEDAFVDVDSIVDTPYGSGRVIAVDAVWSGTSSEYQVELGWGYALLQPECVKWTGVSRVNEPSDFGSDRDEDEPGMEEFDDAGEISVAGETSMATLEDMLSEDEIPQDAGDGLGYASAEDGNGSSERSSGANVGLNGGGYDEPLWPGNMSQSIAGFTDAGSEVTTLEETVEQEEFKEGSPLGLRSRTHPSQVTGMRVAAEGPEGAAAAAMELGPPPPAVDRFDPEMERMVQECIRRGEKAQYQHEAETPMSILTPGDHKFLRSGVVGTTPFSALTSFSDQGATPPAAPDELRHCEANHSAIKQLCFEESNGADMKLNEHSMGESPVQALEIRAMVVQGDAQSRDVPGREGLLVSTSAHLTKNEEEDDDEEDQQFALSSELMITHSRSTSPRSAGEGASDEEGGIAHEAR